MTWKKSKYPYHLRPHHLICLQLFSGNGYDEAFTARMQSVCDLMRSRPEERFVLANGADDICAACPNRAGDQSCALGEEDVRERDQNALAALALRAGGVYSFAEIGARIAERMDEEAFERVCGGCQWKEAEVCSFRALSPNPSPRV